MSKSKLLDKNGQPIYSGLDVEQKAKLEEARNTWLDNKTLDELPEIDQDQKEQLWKQCKEWHLKSKEYAIDFMKKATFVAINRTGLKRPPRGTDPKAAAQMLSYQMKKMGIRIESWPRLDQIKAFVEDAVKYKEHWKAGTYVYKDDVLAYFVSYPFTIGDLDIYWRVMTNVPVDVTVRNPNTITIH